MKKAKLAVIGTGMLAQHQHIPNLLKLDNAELYAICDLDRELLDELGDYYGVERRVIDYKEILADPEIDGVIIVTKADLHAPLTLEALAAGKHVYVEKPLAETVEECNKVSEAQKKAGKIVAIGMNRRMAPAYRYAKELLWKKGGPKSIYYRIAGNWNKEAGEGLRIVHEVCHIFDILRFFTDSEVKSIYCVSSRPDEEIITMQFESGTVATILNSGYTDTSMPKEHFEATAEHGGVIVNEFTEVKQYSIDASEPDVKTFAGHSHPKHDLIHEYLLEELGMQGVEAIRRVTRRGFERLVELEKQGKTDCAEYRQMVELDKRAPLSNYFMDKGWTSALEDFADAILNKRDFAGAKALDGLISAQITEAAMQSRSSGEVVKL